MKILNNVIKYIEKNILNKKIEPYLFYSLCLLGILPLFFSRYFVTLDGPSHLYNANIIKELLFGKNIEIHNLFSINTIPVPNWTSHFLLALLNLFFPSFISEKIFLLFYFLATPYFFRKFILQLYPTNRIFSYFIILFIHNHLLYFGFFNFSIGFTFLFLACYYFSKYCIQFKIKNLIILSIILLIIYFSHVFIFLISLLTLVSIVFVSLKIENEGLYNKITNFQKIGIRLLLLAISAIPALILSIIYFLNVDSIENAQRPDLSLLFKWILDIRPLLTLCYCDSWKILTHILFSLLLLIIISNLYILLKENVKLTKYSVYWHFSNNTSNLWLLISAFFLFLFLIFPNAILLTDRLILIFFLFLIIWLASLRHHKIIHIITFIIIVFVHLGFVSKHIKAMKELANDMTNLEEITQKVPRNNLILTLNYSDNWLYQHITGYLGSNLDIPVLENYEAGLKWFPIQWSNKKYRITKLCQLGSINKSFACDFYINQQDTTCFSLLTIDNKVCPIPYVLRIRFKDNIPDRCSLKLESLINNYYINICENDLCTLYKLRR